jgi:hypothetical protein
MQWKTTLFQSITEQQRVATLLWEGRAQRGEGRTSRQLYNTVQPPRPLAAPQGRRVCLQHTNQLAASKATSKTSNTTSVQRLAMRGWWDVGG